MSGEMYKEDIEQGGDYYGIRKEMEDIGHKAGMVVHVEPFDVYQGPKGNMFLGTKKLGTLWGEEDKWTFLPEYDVKLMMSVMPAKLTKMQMISRLKKLKEKMPTHKPFDVLKGQKPSHYQTPSLKKAQQKSLLKLVKSKYKLVESQHD